MVRSACRRGGGWGINPTCLWDRWQPRPYRADYRSPQRIPGFSACANRQRSLFAIAAGYLWRDARLILSVQQVCHAHRLRCVDTHPATAQLALRQLATTRRRNLGGPRPPPAFWLLESDVLGGVRPWDPSG